MKVFAFLLVSALSLTAGAWGLDSHYGVVSNHGSDYTCTFHNKTNHALDMKYVVFNVDRMSGDSNSNDVQDRIDKVVAAGDTLSASTNIVGPYVVNYCKFLAR